MSRRSRYLFPFFLSFFFAALAHANDANYILSVVNTRQETILVRRSGPWCVSWAVSLGDLFRGTANDTATLAPNEVLAFGLFRTGGDCHGKSGFFSIEISPATGTPSWSTQAIYIDADGSMWINPKQSAGYLNKLTGFGRILGDTAVYEFHIGGDRPIVKQPPVPDANYILSIVNLQTQPVHVQVLPNGSMTHCVVMNAPQAPVQLAANDVLAFGFYRSGDCHGENGYIGIRAAGPGMPFHTLADDDLQILTFDAAGNLGLTDPHSVFLKRVENFDRIMGDTAVYELHILPQPPPKPLVTLSQTLVEKYAPLIYLDPNERFFPGDLPTFFSNTMVTCDTRLITQNAATLTVSQLPSGRGAATPGTPDAHCRLDTRTPMTDPHQILPFFAGQPPTATYQPPVYVYIYDYISDDEFTAQYNTFYPYNQGKTVCRGLYLLGSCPGFFGTDEAGDHVADWEMATIRFAGGKPIAVHVGAHGNDEPQTASTYRSIGWGVLSWEGDHPIIYSAQGSHGTWATAGPHAYNSLPNGDTLTDDTGKGKRWETWRNVVLTGTQYDPALNRLVNGINDFLFFRYNGDWGNLHLGKDACEISVIDNPPLCELLGIPRGSEYELTSGPSMPDHDRDRHYVGIPVLPIPHQLYNLKIHIKMGGQDMPDYIGFWVDLDERNQPIFLKEELAPPWLAGTSHDFEITMRQPIETIGDHITKCSFHEALFSSFTKMGPYYIDEVMLTASDDTLSIPIFEKIGYPVYAYDYGHRFYVAEIACP